jgi:hypothetical protein
MDIQRVDLLLQYALAVASEEDDFKNRRLGAIHLIKYVYLADLAYAEKSGFSYTQAPWIFHKFGPWSVEVFNRIPPALKSIGAECHSFQSQYEDDIIKWSVHSDYLLRDLELKIDRVPGSAIKKSVHRFGADTESLLTHVYLTRPLLTAAPKESLNFNQVKVSEDANEYTVQNEREFSSKKNNKIINQVKKQIQAKLAFKKAQTKKCVNSFIEPRYDTVFFQGQEWLDSLEGNSVLPLKGEATFSAEIWKSKARFDPDVS